MAIREGVCTDGYAFRWAGPNPVTWAFTLTSGGVTTPRAAEEADVGHGQRYYGCGIIELGHELTVRADPRLINCN